MESVANKLANSGEPDGNFLESVAKESPNSDELDGNLMGSVDKKSPNSDELDGNLMGSVDKKSTNSDESDGCFTGSDANESFDMAANRFPAATGFGSFSFGFSPAVKFDWSGRGFSVYLLNEPTGGSPPRVPHRKVPNEDKAVLQLWSYNSSCGGSYVCIDKAVKGGNEERPDDPAKNQTDDLKVVARGRAEGELLPLTKITFEEAENTQNSTRYTQAFFLKFSYQGKTYKVYATEKEVKLIEDRKDVKGTAFYMLELDTSEPYYCFKAEMPESKKSLYLSSDGAGNMKLKVWNLPTNDDGLFPRRFVDPALLFRVVLPSE